MYLTHIINSDYVMKYSAGIVSFSFWLYESKTTAEYLLENISKKELIDLSLSENIYQVGSERRSKRMASYLYNRFKDFSQDLLRYFINADSNTSKIIVLISIIKNDKLFFEFMYELFREQILLGSYTIKDSDLDIFFRNKSNQSEIIENWSEKTISRLKRMYKSFLIEAGLLEEEDGVYKIILPFIDYRLKELLIQNNLTPYLNAITGEG